MNRSLNLPLIAVATPFALCWLLPGHYWPWLSFQQEFAAAVGALLLGLLIQLRAKAAAWPPLALGALAIAAVPWLQWQFGLVRYLSDALMASVYLAGFGLCIAAGATAVKSRNGNVLAVVLGALTFGAAVSVALALMQWQHIQVSHFFDTTQRGARTWANLGQPNHLASALAIGVCATLLAHSRRAVSGWITVVMLVWLGFGLITTESRTGYVFVVMLTVGMLAYRRKARLELHPLKIVAGALLFFVGVELWPVLNAALEMSEPPGLLERLATGAHRVVHWQVIADAILQSPWVGYGWTQVALAQHAAVAGHPATGEVLSSSHNIVLDLLAWNGLPIGLVIIGCVIWWFLRQFKACDKPERFFALAIVCAVALHALLEFPLEYAYFLLPLGLAVGSLEGHEDGVPLSNSIPSRAAFASLWAVLAVMTSWIAVEYMHVESTSRVLRFVSMGIGTDKVNHAPEPEVLLLDRPKQVHRFMLTPARKDPDPAYMDWVRFMATRHATPPGMLRHAMAAGFNERPEEAAQVLGRMCKVFKRHVCEQSRQSWLQIQKHYPELAGISFPEPLLP